MGAATAFTDASSNVPTSWAWSSNPSTGVTISTTTSQNPSITFTTAGNYTVSLTATNAQGNNSVSHTITVTNCATTCDTLKNINATTNGTALYWADNVAPHDSGYAFGTNAYLDSAKAEGYTTPPAGKSLKAIVIGLHKAGTGSVKFKIWNDNAGLPGTVKAVQTVTLPSLTSNAFNIIQLTTPVAVVGKFYVGFSIPTTAGDTIAVFANSTAMTAPTVNLGFEEWNDGSWHNDSAVYGGSKFNYHIYPVFCPTTGIQDYSNIYTVDIYPNPSKGNFSVSAILQNEDNLVISVYDVVGREITSIRKGSTYGGLYNIDLSGNDAGIYFVKVSTTQGNVTKKIILEK
jgi:PKD repeat protein